MSKLLFFFSILIAASHSVSISCVNRLSMDQRQRILYYHNAYRNKLAAGNLSMFPSAGNMKEIVWDYDIENFVQSQLNEGKKSFLKEERKKAMPYGPKGENFFEFVQPQIGNFFEGFFNTTSVIEMWFQESSRYIHPIDNFTLFTSPHFTQMAWAETEKIGCGIVECVRHYGNRFAPYDVQIVVMNCNYYPEGNVKGKPIYEKGEPCSLCGGKCSMKYRYLCPVEKNNDLTFFFF